MVVSIAVEPSSPVPTAEGEARDVSAGDAVALLAVVADPSRYALIRALTAGTTCVCALQSRVPIAANLLSYHLKVLREAELITAARRGRWIDYTLAPDALARLHAAIPGAAPEFGHGAS